MNSHRHFNERGVINAWQVATIGLSVLFVATGSFAIWAFVNYSDATSNLDDKIAIKVSAAKEDQRNDDEAKFREIENSPTKTFIGPDDYCGLTFQYSKKWSEYRSERLTNGGAFKAYFNPDYVPAVSNSQQFALRVLIEQRDYDDVVNSYDSLLQKGSLRQSSQSSNGQTGKRLTGDFSKDIRGDAVIFRCRDKTITVRTDAVSAFKKQFDELIRTIKFNE